MSSARVVFLCGVIFALATVAFTATASDYPPRPQPTTTLPVTSTTAPVPTLPATQ